MTGRRAIIVHDLEHARLALAAADACRTPVTLRSAPAAAAYLGAPVFREMIAEARAEFPDVDAIAVLDCGRHAGFALAALRAGIERVRVDLPATTRAKLADLAAQMGATLDDDDAPVFDPLACENPAEGCRTWLSTA